MKKLIAISILGSLLSLGALASESEIISVQQVDETTLSVTVKTPFYCNDPIVSLEYDHSGRAIFGPHFFSVPVVGVNRMACPGAEDVTVLLPLPENMKAGDVMVFSGTVGTPQSLQIQ